MFVDWETSPLRDLHLLKINELQWRAVGMNDLLNVEWRIDKLKMFDQVLEERSMAIEMLPDMAPWKGLYHRRFGKSTLMKSALGLFPFGSGSPKRAEALHQVERNGRRHSGRSTRSSCISERDRLHQKTEQSQSFRPSKVTERTEIADIGHPQA